LHRVSGPSLYNRDVCECHLSCDIGKTSAKTTLTDSSPGKARNH